MNVTAKKAISLSEAISSVLERVETLQAENKTRVEILVELNRLIHDTSLFSQKQRASVVRDLNKRFALNVTMSEIKKAHRTVNTAKPEKAVPVSGLSGAAILELQLDPQASTGPDGQITPPDTLNPISPPSTTLEPEAMAIKETLSAVSQKINVDAKVDASAVHKEAVLKLKEELAVYKIIYPEILFEILKEFFKVYPEGLPQFDNASKMQFPAYSNPNVIDYLAVLFAIDPVQHTNFFSFLKEQTMKTPEAVIDTPAPVAATESAPQATVQAAAPAPGPSAEQPAVAAAVAVAVDKSLTDRVMTTIRGNRETGFSSGTVAAAAALIGGGLEIAFKGSVGIGSALGTAAGATGAYFLGNASEKLMDTETGRYLLAGAIGVVAGGIGSRAGRYIQGEFTNPDTAIDTAIETATGLPAPQAAPVSNNTEALSAMLGL